MDGGETRLPSAAAPLSTYEVSPRRRRRRPSSIPLLQGLKSQEAAAGENKNEEEKKRVRRELLGPPCVPTTEGREKDRRWDGIKARLNISRRDATKIPLAITMKYIYAINK